MKAWAVLATGPSLSVDQVDRVRGLCRVVAVSDAYKLAPWADCLVSADAAWWKAHPDARHFSAEKWGEVCDFQNVPYVSPMHVGSGRNSGLLGVMLAVRKGADRVILLGFDLHSPGKHFFGEHPSLSSLRLSASSADADGPGASRLHITVIS